MQRRDTPTNQPRIAERQETDLPHVVSLFCGAGGLDLGFKEVGYPIKVAIDASPAAVKTHQRNFPDCKAHIGDLLTLGPEGVLDMVEKVIPVGERVGIIGGPPCQGFSRANTAAQADDPRNRLPSLYVAIVRALQAKYVVEFVVFENVLGIRDRKHAPTYENLLKGLRDQGLNVKETMLCALDFGVPQKRHRVILAGFRRHHAHMSFAPRRRSGPKTVREVIGSLLPPSFFARGLDPKSFAEHPNHWTMRPRSERFSKDLKRTPNGRSFKVLDWDHPSPTIAFGHREIHVHPEGKRRLSIFEAMQLQGFPRSFVLEGNLSEQVEQISNAVPPPLARSVARAVLRSLKPAS